MSSSNLNTKVAVLSVEGLESKGDADKIEKQLKNDNAGIFDVRVDLQYKEVRVTYDATFYYPELVAAKVEQIGFSSKILTIEEPRKRHKSVIDSLTVDPADTKLAILDIENLSSDEDRLTIEEVIKKHSGVAEIHVSLMDKEARIRFDEKVRTAENLVADVTDLGFQAEIVDVQDGRRQRVRGSTVSFLLETEFDKLQCKTVVIKISGMIGRSCTTMIGTKLKKKVGIYDTRVWLDDGRAQIWFDPVVWSSQEIADLIDNMGFNTYILAEKDDSDYSSTLKMDDDDVFDGAAVAPNWAQNISLSLKGLACIHCAQIIEEIMAEKHGIFTADISLEMKKCKLAFDAKLWSSEKIINVLRDMGIDVLLEWSDDTVFEEEIPCDSGETRRREQKCILSVEEIRSFSCVEYIEKNLMKVEGVSNAFVDLLSKEVEIKFDPDLTSSFELSEKVVNLGYKVVVMGKKEAKRKIELDLTNFTDQSGALEPLLFSHLPGIVAVTVSLEKSRVSILYGREQVAAREIAEFIKSHNYGVSVVKSEKTEEDRDLTKSTLLINPVTSGIVLDCGMTLLIILSLDPVRRVFWNGFYLLHLSLATLVIIFGIFHQCFIAIGVGAGLWIVDVFFRYLYLAMLKNPNKATAVRLPANVIRLSFPKPNNFVFSPGQYAFLMIPKVNMFEWHPFSMSSSPHHDVLCFHIRVLGNWTKKLYKMLENEEEISVHAEGPYGNPEIDLEDNKHKLFLFISGGIGITPMQSMCNHLIHQCDKGRPIKKIWFLWSCADKYMVSSVFEHDRQWDGISNKDINRLPRSFQPDDLERINADTGGKEVLRTEFYLTRVRPEEGYDGGNIRLEFQPYVRFGRPKLPEVFASMKSLAKEKGENHVCVLACGPGALVNETRKYCSKVSGDGVRFDFHSENFEF